MAGPATAAYVGDTSLPLDHAQYDADDGPCLTAYRTGETVGIADVAEVADRWPKFAAAAAEAGIVSSLSLPLKLKTEVVGALNLYTLPGPSPSPTNGCISRDCSPNKPPSAVTNAEIYWKTYTLTQNLIGALENRDRIGQAKGILATRLGITTDQAFDTSDAPPNTSTSNSATSPTTSPKPANSPRHPTDKTSSRRHRHDETVSGRRGTSSALSGGS